MFLLRRQIRSEYSDVARTVVCSESQIKNCKNDTDVSSVIHVSCKQKWLPKQKKKKTPLIPSD